MTDLIGSIRRRLGRSSGRARPGFGFEQPFWVDERTKLSAGSFVGRYSIVCQGTVSGDVRIGRFCSIAPGFSIIAGNHPITFLTTHSFILNNLLFGDHPEYRDIDFKRKLEEDINFRKRLEAQEPAADRQGPLMIGNDVWVGDRVIIVPRVRSIGNGAVVGAGAVVAHDIPPYAVVAGNPARVLKYRFGDAIITELEALRWWELPLQQIKHLDFSDPASCISELGRIRRTIESQKGEAG